MIYIKPAYYDYAKYMWRFYVLHEKADMSRYNDINRENWNACHKAFANYNQNERELIRSFYADNDMNDKYAAAKYGNQNNLPDTYVWHVIKKSMRDAAINRGLWENRKEME